MCFHYYFRLDLVGLHLAVLDLVGPVDPVVHVVLVAPVVAAVAAALVVAAAVVAVVAVEALAYPLVYYLFDCSESYYCLGV